MQPTSQKSPPQISPEQTCGQEDSRVRIFRSLAASEGLTEQEVDSFLLLLNSSKAKVLKIDPHGLSLKMLRISYPFMEDGTLRPFSIRWPHSAIACQDDKSLKSTLTPIIGKLSDMRIVAAELDYLLYEPFKEFITMAFLLIGNIPLLYFLNKDWYDVLVNTGFGKGILAVCLLVLLISFAAVIRLTKPVEYKR